MKYRISKIALCIVVAHYIIQNSYAQSKIDTINASNKSLLLSKIKEATTSYLVYFIDSSKTIRTGVGDLWERKISKSKLNGNGIINFYWKWVSTSGFTRETTSLLDSKTFAPITYYAINKSPRKTDTISYVFENGYLTKDRRVKGNSVNESFNIKLDIPVLNWALDLETYPLLPIKKIGQIFDIAFFDVNESKAIYHRYQVIGEDKLEVFEQIKIPCWLLKINYDEENSSTFWLSKKTGEVIKSEERVIFGNKVMYSIKIRQIK